jgi:hypothetical protein
VRSSLSPTVSAPPAGRSSGSGVVAAALVATAIVGAAGGWGAGVGVALICAGLAVIAWAIRRRDA